MSLSDNVIINSDDVRRCQIHSSKVHQQLLSASASKQRPSSDPKGAFGAGLPQERIPSSVRRIPTLPGHLHRRLHVRDDHEVEHQNRIETRRRLPGGFRRQPLRPLLAVSGGRHSRRHSGPDRARTVPMGRLLGDVSASDSKQGRRSSKSRFCRPVFEAVLAAVVVRFGRRQIHREVLRVLRRGVRERGRCPESEECQELRQEPGQKSRKSYYL